MNKSIITTLFMLLGGLLLFAQDLRLELYSEGRIPNYRDVGEWVVSQNSNTTSE